MENAYPIKFLNPEHVERLYELRREGKISWRCLGLGVALVSFINRESGTAWPARATLSNMTGIDIRDISRELHELEVVEFIEIQHQSGGSNVYRISPDGESAPLGRSNTPWDDPPDDELESEPRGPTTSTGYSATHNKENKSNYRESLHEELERISKQNSPVSWNGNEFRVANEIKEEWRRKYPSLYIEEELRRASSWCRRKKPPSNIGDFLERWMARSAAESDAAVDVTSNYKKAVSPNNRSMPPGHNLQTMFKAQGIENGGNR